MHSLSQFCSVIFTYIYSFAHKHFSWVCLWLAAGEVNVSLSSVVRFSSKVPKLSKNEIVVQLVDSYLNPVLSQQSRLKLEIAASTNSSGFLTLDIKDNKDGSYSCSYMAKDVGTYEICASFDGKRFLSCPFSINVYSCKYKQHAAYGFYHCYYFGMYAACLMLKSYIYAS